MNFTQELVRASRVLTFGAIAALILLIGWPQLESSLGVAQRYAEREKSDWKAADVWVQSANCARQTGVWLVVCENGRLIPISDRAVADDPGHAFLLGLFARVAGRDVNLADVARLNLWINVTGLMLLSALLLALRSFLTVLVLLALGPYVFLEWFGTSPHWSFLGLMAMQTLVPLALISGERGWTRPRITWTFLVLGLASAALGAVVRESIGTTSLIINLVVTGWTAKHRWRQGRQIASVLLIGIIAISTIFTPRLIVAARDAVFNVEPARLIATHGMAHTLYIGLGAVENKFGLHYDDADGRRDAAAVAPDIEYQSPAYAKLMWSLYFQRWHDDPREVARIYLEKFRLIMADRILDSSPPLWLFLLLVCTLHLISNNGRLTCGRPFCDTRLALNLVSLAFVGLIVLQTILAVPTRYYAAPIGVFMLIMLGVAFENLAGWLWRKSFSDRRRGHGSNDESN